MGSVHLHTFNYNMVLYFSRYFFSHNNYYILFIVFPVISQLIAVCFTPRYNLYHAYFSPFRFLKEKLAWGRGYR